MKLICLLSLINKHVHKTCYNKLTRKLPSINATKKQIEECLELSVNVLNDISSIESLSNVARAELNNWDGICV